MSRSPLSLPVIMLACLPITGLAEDMDSHAAHQHGMAQLTLVLEKNTVQVALESPADNIVGFEHAATKPGEKAAVAAAISTLSQPTLLGLSTEAGCSKATTRIKKMLATPEHSAHRDIEVSHTLSCSQPDKLKQLDASALFKAFPRMQSLKVEFALPAGQGSVILTPNAPLATLVRG